MLQTLFRVVKSGIGLLTSTAPAPSGGNSLDKLNVISLLVQAGNAFRKGEPMKGAILIGAATIAPKNRKLSYLVQGVVTADNIRKRFK
ncbi:hypothetical protein SAMN05421858_1722 [Haladaptatus litoreus]|uniref:Uncharacterized protein n=1 Tax=Haladaptatus litoreus TaxID=553468 RepID=A0A1N6YUD0_9EURY|nr:hypothetical protein SAMN05421858_1722 [Haladaptatus litoreus]